MLTYRTWTITVDPLAEIEYLDVAPHRLLSLSRPASHIWIPNSNWAKCVSYSSDEHKSELCKRSPNKDCKQEYGCGLYSYTDYKLLHRKTMDALDFPPRCIGIVWSWGTVIDHDDNTVRSEIMDIWALCGMPYMYTRNADYRDDFAEIAIRMQLPYYISESTCETLAWLGNMSEKLMRKK